MTSTPFTEIVRTPAHRPAYVPGQRLRLAELTDEREQRSRADRTHRLAPHGHGVVQGLELSVHGDDLVLHPGVAVDGLGFELVVEQAFVVELREHLETLGDAFDVSITRGSEPEADETGCERAELSLSPPETSEAADDETSAASRPPETVPPELASAPAVTRGRTAEPPWAVPLGRFERGDGGWTVTLAERRRTLTTARLVAADRRHEWWLSGGAARLRSERTPSLCACDDRGLTLAGALRSRDLHLGDGLAFPSPAAEPTPDGALAATEDDDGRALRLALPSRGGAALSVGPLRVSSAGARVAGRLALKPRAATKAAESSTGGGP